ncbi:MAG: hypothetical protein ACREKM_10130 [Longimicrobiales bacterium]
MRTLMMATAMLLLAGCDGGLETRTFALEYMQPDIAFKMIEPYVPGGAENMRMTERPAALTITAPEVRLEQVAQVLATYDRGRPDVQMRFQIIEADGFSETDAAIADVQDALHDLFRFNGYRLLAEAVVRAQAPGYVEQQLAAGEREFTIVAHLERVIGSDADRAVDLGITLRNSFGNTLITTVMTVPSGQTVVVGSARARSDGNTLILVVRPEIR